jgi:hypothetical protein
MRSGDVALRLSILFSVAWRWAALLTAVKCPPLRGAAAWRAYGPPWPVPEPRPSAGATPHASRRSSAPIRAAAHPDSLPVRGRPRFDDQMLQPHNAGVSQHAIVVVIGPRAEQISSGAPRQPKAMATVRARGRDHELLHHPSFRRRWRLQVERPQTRQIRRACGCLRFQQRMRLQNAEAIR